MSKLEYVTEMCYDELSNSWDEAYIPILRKIEQGHINIYRGCMEFVVVNTNGGAGLTFSERKLFKQYIDSRYGVTVSYETCNSVYTKYGIVEGMYIKHM